MYCIFIIIVFFFLLFAIDFLSHILLIVSNLFWWVFLWFYCIVFVSFLAYLRVTLSSLIYERNQVNLLGLLFVTLHWSHRHALFFLAPVHTAGRAQLQASGSSSRVDAGNMGTWTLIFQLMACLSSHSITLLSSFSLHCLCRDSVCGHCVLSIKPEPCCSSW